MCVFENAQLVKGCNKGLQKKKKEKIELQAELSRGKKEDMKRIISFDTMQLYGVAGVNVTWEVRVARCFSGKLHCIMTRRQCHSCGVMTTPFSLRSYH